MSRRIGAQENTSKWTHGNTMMPSLSPLAMVLSEAVTSALGRARTHLHTHTYAN